MRLLLTSLAALTLFAASASADPNWEKTLGELQMSVKGETLYMNGGLDSYSTEQVARILDENPQIKTAVLLDMPGTDDVDATLETGMLLNRAGIKTYLTSHSSIASGAVDLFCAGVEREVEPGAQIGIHTWYNDDGTEGRFLSQDDPEHDTQLKFLSKTGCSVGLYWFSLRAASPNDIHWMTKDEMESYSVVTKFVGK
ncbi:MAG: hypothetical protein V3V03_04030 [Hyphomonadaceae bacterium]